MSFLKKASKAFRKVYNLTSKSKFAKYDPILTGVYHTRKGWKSLKNRLPSMIGGSSSVNSAGSYSASSDVHGPTGSIVGRF